MEKSTFLLSLSLATCAGRAIAQHRAAALIEVPALKLTEGKNVVPVPEVKGAIEFNKSGDRFTDVVVIDEHGHATRLANSPRQSTGLPGMPCQFPIPDACFSMPNSQEVAMCFCKPTDLPNGEYAVTIKKAILPGFILH